MIYNKQLDFNQFKNIFKMAGLGDDLRQCDDVIYSTMMSVKIRERNDGRYGNNKYLPMLVRMAYGNGKILECFDVSDLTGDTLRRYINFLGGFQDLGKELGILTPYQWMSRGFNPGKAKQEKLKELFETRLAWIRSLYHQLPNEHTESMGLCKDVSFDQLREIITKLGTADVAQLLGVTKQVVNIWRSDIKDKRRLPKSEVRALLRDLLIDTYQEMSQNPFPCEEMLPLRQHFNLTGMSPKMFAVMDDIKLSTFNSRLSGGSVPNFSEKTVRIINKLIAKEYHDFLLRNVRSTKDD